MPGRILINGSINGRPARRSDEVRQVRTDNEQIDAFFRLQQQGRATQDPDMLLRIAQLASTESGGTDVGDEILSSWGSGGGGDGDAGGDGGGSAGGGDGGGGAGSDGGSSGGTGDGGTGDGGSGGDGGD